MRAVILFDNFGPYHMARLAAAAPVIELSALQTGSRSAEYAWINELQSSQLKLTTLFPGRTSRELGRGELDRKLGQALVAADPEVVFIPGWSGPAAFSALRWCLRRKVPAVVMSESTEQDEKRTGWKEWVKGRFVRLCSAALAGGEPHRNYLLQLGLPADRIFLGYDAVDNEYFAQGAAQVRNQESATRKKFGLPENYFVASNRFIAKKNLPRLIEAYAQYRAMVKPTGAPWDLVLLGDGELRPALESQISALHLQASVQLPGFRQYPDLPAYYGLAGAFIHASTTEQWGLVVNEAMASGLPVLVSRRCGCAADLVQEGVNGFTFDPQDVRQLAELMSKISAPGFPLSQFGLESRRLIAGWGPERFAAGIKSAAGKALAVGPKPAGMVDRLLLSALLYR